MGSVPPCLGETAELGAGWDWGCRGWEEAHPPGRMSYCLSLCPQKALHLHLPAELLPLHRAPGAPWPGSATCALSSSSWTSRCSTR